MWWVPVLTLAGCTLSVDDFDGDGWTVLQGDCDDLDPSVNPKLDDEIDGVDRNCDGSTTVMRDAGIDHECALLDGGGVDCIGDNSHGQLDVPDHASAFVQIAAGDYHTCGLDLAGFVACWGDDTYGQSSPPYPDGYVAIDADGNYSLGTLAGDEIQPPVCWGLCPRVKMH